MTGDIYQAHRRLAWRMAEDGTDRVAKHPYFRDVHSGAGNCWCGRHEESPIHQDVSDAVAAQYHYLNAWARTKDGST